jgi:hypothetical protein
MAASTTIAVMMPGGRPDALASNAVVGMIGRLVEVAAGTVARLEHEAEVVSFGKDELSSSSMVLEMVETCVTVAMLTLSLTDGSAPWEPTTVTGSGTATVVTSLIVSVSKLVSVGDCGEVIAEVASVTAAEDVDAASPPLLTAA